jgi:hypothetical protein
LNPEILHQLNITNNNNGSILLISL